MFRKLLVKRAREGVCGREAKIEPWETRASCARDADVMKTEGELPNRRLKNWAEFRSEGRELAMAQCAWEKIEVAQKW